MNTLQSASEDRWLKQTDTWAKPADTLTFRDLITPEGVKAWFNAVLWRIPDSKELGIDLPSAETDIVDDDYQNGRTPTRYLETQMQAPKALPTLEESNETIRLIASDFWKKGRGAEDQKNSWVEAPVKHTELNRQVWVKMDGILQAQTDSNPRVHSQAPGVSTWRHRVMNWLKSTEGIVTRVPEVWTVRKNKKINAELIGPGTNLTLRLHSGEVVTLRFYKLSKRRDSKGLPLFEFTDGVAYRYLLSRESIDGFIGYLVCTIQEDSYVPKNTRAEILDISYGSPQTSHRPPHNSTGYLSEVIRWFSRYFPKITSDKNR